MLKLLVNSNQLANGATPLQSWHSSSNWNWPRIAVGTMSLLAFVAFSAFCLTLIQPYRKSQLHVVVIGPGLSSVDSPFDQHGALIAEQYANTADTLRALQEINSTCHFVTDIVNSGPGLSDRLLQTLDAECCSAGAICVSISGLIKVTSEGCLLCDSHNNAMKEHGVNLKRLVSQLSRSKQKPLLLCIEGRVHPINETLSIADGSVVEQCRDEIEHQLASLENSPISVLLIPPADAFNMNAPTFGATLRDVLRARTANGIDCISLAELRSGLSKKIAGADIWLDSPAWQTANSLHIAIPADNPSTETHLAEHTVPNADADGTHSETSMIPGQLISQNSRIASSPSKHLSSSMTEEQFLAAASLASTTELVSYSRQVRNLWLTVPEKSGQATARTNVPLRAEYAPFAWNAFENFLLDARRYQNLDFTPQVHDSVIQVAIALHAADQTTHSVAPSDRLSGSLDSLQWTKPFSSIHHSGLQHDTFISSLYFREKWTDIDEASQQLVFALQRFNDANLSETEALRILEPQLPSAAIKSASAEITESDLGTRAMVYSEVEWGNYFASLSYLDWPTRRKLIASKLLSIRLLTKAWYITESLSVFQEAEKARIESEQLVSLRTATDWHGRALELSELAFDKYSACTRYIEAVHQAERVMADIGREIVAWNRVLLPIDNESHENDPIILVAQRIAELQTRIATNQIDETESITRLTQTLRGLRRSWHDELDAAFRSGNKKNSQLSVEEGILTLLANSHDFDGSTALSKTLQNDANTHNQLLIQIERLRSLAETTFRSAVCEIPSDLNRVMLQAQDTVASTSSEASDINRSLLHLEHSLQRSLQTLQQRLEDTTVSHSPSRLAAILLVALGGGDLSLDATIEQREHAKLIHYCLANIRQREQQLAYSNQFTEPLLTKEIAEWKRCYFALTDQTTNRTDSPFEITAPPMIDLTLNETRQFSFSIQNHDIGANDAKITVSFDQSWLDCELDIPAQVSPGQLQFTWRLEAAEVCTVNTRITPVTTHGSQRPIVFTIESGEYRRSHVIELRTAATPLVQLNLSNRSSMTPSGFHTESPTDDALFPNRTSPLSIEVRNPRSTPVNLSYTLYTAEDLLAPMPVGALPAETAEGWLASHSIDPIVSSSKPLRLAVGESRDMKLPPLKVATNKPPQTFRSLLFVFRETNTGEVQLVNWIPRVVRPLGYIQHRVQYNAEQREIQVFFELDEHHRSPGDAVQISATVLNPSDLSPLSSARVEIPINRRTQELALRVADSKIPEVILKVEIDQWPNSHLFRINLRQDSYNIPLSEDIIGIQLFDRSTNERSNSDARIIANNAASVQVGVSVLLSDTALADPNFAADSAANQQTSLQQRNLIAVGIDLNRDRYLRDEPVKRIEAPRTVTMTWQGCDAGGNLLVRCTVDNPLIDLPIRPDWNQRFSVLGFARQGANIQWSTGIECLADHLPPKIIRAYSTTSEFQQLGKPTEIRLDVDDSGLSGVSHVVGSWSPSGTPEFSTTTKPIAAVRLSDTTWSLVLPTAELRSGSSLLLVQATDRAGNVSTTFHRYFDYFTPEQIQAKRRAITTLVQGRIIYGQRPVPKISVAIEAVDDNGNFTQKTTQSSETGEFDFDDIPSGSYTVKLSGVFRGMQLQREREITVMAPNMPSQIVFRLDQVTVAGNASQ